MYILFICFHQMACEKLLDVVNGLVPPNQEPAKTAEDQGRVKTKSRKGMCIYICFKFK